MNLDRLINAESDIANLIDAFRRAVHASPDASHKLVEQYPELRQPVAATRDVVAKNPKVGLELENLAIEGLAENGWAALERKAASHAPDHAPASALLAQDVADSGGHAEAAVKSVDFSRVINSVEDIRHLVAAYRLALHGGTDVAQKMFDAFPGLESVVKRTQTYAEFDHGAGEHRVWEEIGVEALVERGLKTLDDKGLNPFKHSDLAPER